MPAERTAHVVDLVDFGHRHHTADRYERTLWHTLRELRALTGDRLTAVLDTLAWLYSNPDTARFLLGPARDQWSARYTTRPDETASVAAPA